jgi:hypothetical protein
MEPSKPRLPLHQPPKNPSHNLKRRERKSGVLRLIHLYRIELIITIPMDKHRKPIKLAKKKHNIASRLYPESFYETISAKITDKPEPVEPQPRAKQNQASGT